MPSEALQHLSDLQSKSLEKHYAYIRHLLLLASGSLTVLVSLNVGAADHGVSQWLLKSALASIGIGILNGSVALYGEVWLAKQAVPRMAEAYKKLSELPAHELSFEPEKVVSVTKPIWMKASEQICYWSLTLAILLLVSFSLART